MIFTAFLCQKYFASFLSEGPSFGRCRTTSPAAQRPPRFALRLGCAPKAHNSTLVPHKMFFQGTCPWKNDWIVFAACGRQQSQAEIQPAQIEYFSRVFDLLHPIVCRPLPSRSPHNRRRCPFQSSRPAAGVEKRRFAAGIRTARRSPRCTPRRRYSGNPET